MAWAASTAMAEDTAISDLLTGLDEDAAAVSSLNTTFRDASPEELQVLFRRLEDLAADRPDIVDIAIVQGLRSGDDVLRHQALWLVLKRMRVFTCRVDFDQSASNEGRIRGNIGGIVSLPLFEADDARRSISLEDGNRDSGRPHLSLVGDNVSVRAFGNNWSFSGVFSLSSDGQTLTGPADYRASSENLNIVCAVDLL